MKTSQLTKDIETGSQAFLLQPDWILSSPFPYRLEEEIGRGGLSTVYRAVLADGSDPRPVALKVLRPGTDPQDISRRFQRESEILAELRHPGIAQLLGGGMTEDGRPYLVMELIDGEVLSSYLSTAEPTLRERIRLFIELCEIVAYAHRRLVVHGDLKPSNVLVTTDFRPKLLDFGISKLIDAPGSVTEPTRGLSGLTPEYASPEQLRGLPLTLATDVYSLGVMLHEALVGSRPGQESETLSRVAARQGMTTLARSLSGDLDAIVDRCLQTDPERRYPSVERLADDLERYLSGRPITTRPSTFFYRGRKLLSRHRYAFGAALVVLVALLGFFWDREQRRQVLSAERDRATVVNDFLIEVFRSVDPAIPLRASSSLKSVLALGAERHDQLKDSPRSYAALGGALGELYFSLGDWEAAKVLYSESRQAAERMHGPEPHRDVVLADLRLGTWAQRTGRLGLSQAWLQKALTGARELSEDTLEAEALTQMGLGFIQLLDLEEAEASLAAAVEILERGSQFGELADARIHLANVKRRRGRLVEGKALLERSLAELEAETGPDHVLVARGNWTLGMLLWIGERDARAAEAPLSKALGIYSRVFGESHPTTINIRNVVANHARSSGHLHQAEALLRKNLSLLKADTQELKSAKGMTLSILSHIFLANGDLAGAERSAREALRLMIEEESDMGPTAERQRRLWFQRLELVEILLDQGRPAEALNELGHAFPSVEKYPSEERDGLHRHQLMGLEAKARQSCGVQMTHEGTTRELERVLAGSEPTPYQRIDLKSLLVRCLVVVEPERAVHLAESILRDEAAQDFPEGWRSYYLALATWAKYWAGALPTEPAVEQLSTYLRGVKDEKIWPLRRRYVADVRAWLDDVRQGPA